MSGITPLNRITRTIVPGATAFPDVYFLTTSSISYNQGDLLILDTTAHTIRKPVSEAECATFAGIAVETVVSGKLKRPYVTAVDGSFGADSIVGPQFSLVAALQLTSGQTLNPGAFVYGDPVTGPFNVQAAGTNAIGVYQGPTVTAGASTFVEVLLGCRVSGALQL